MTIIVAPHSNANKWQMGFNSAFKGLIYRIKEKHTKHTTIYTMIKNRNKEHERI